MIKSERIVIEPFDMKYLQEYCSGFSAEITRYQWPDPFETPDDARNVIRGFLNEMEKGERLFFSVLSGKGEYTVELAQLYPNVNFIGVDIKGARMWTGATKALEAGLKNVAFLRTNIEIIDRFFSENEVQEIWLTFSDPQMKNVHKRLTSTFFLERYRHFLVDNGIIHLKTDSNFLFTYTTYMVEHNELPVLFHTTDLYHTEGIDEETRKILSIQTYYESMWIERGLNIKYMKFLLPHEKQLTESEKEIELDDYRSYHRDKRSSLDTAK